jgi:hypothetical protein
MNLLFDRELFEKFLSKKQVNLEKDNLLESKLKHQSCINLKNTLESCVNSMIKYNKSESTIKYEQLYWVNFEDCGLYKDVRELEDIVSKKTGFNLKIFNEEIPPYFPTHDDSIEANLRILLVPKK